MKPTAGNPVEIKSFDVAGDYIFACEVRNHGKIYVYNASYANLVRTIVEDPAVETDAGWVDLPFGLCAFKRSTGEYVILREEDGHGKNLLVIWSPQHQ
jgi:hypothetical protein